MGKIQRADLMSLEAYDEQRKDFGKQVYAHKRRRRVEVGPHATLYFEDRLTMQFQIQEMLRIEKIFSAEGIQEELDAYNPLIPDGDNLKATFMLEYADPEERKGALQKLNGIEDRVWIQVDGYSPVCAIADEDLERKTEEKTSAVHFLRFQFTPEMIAALKQGASLNVGIDHKNYHHEIKPLDPDTTAALVADLAD